MITPPESLDLITIEYRGDRKPQMHRGNDFDQLTESRQKSKVMLLAEAILRDAIREALLLEELTRSDKKEIEKIAKKQVKKEIENIYRPVIHWYARQN